MQLEIENEIKGFSGKVSVCRATYLAICLDMDEEMTEKFPEEWDVAKSTFEECWKLKQLIFHDAVFPSILRTREQFLEAGITRPEKKIDLPLIWRKEEIFLSADQLMELKATD
jgi:hypothetical protein